MKASQDTAKAQAAHSQQAGQAAQAAQKAADAAKGTATANQAAAVAGASAQAAHSASSAYQASEAASAAQVAASSARSATIVADAQKFANAAMSQAGVAEQARNAALTASKSAVEGAGLAHQAQDQASLARANGGAVAQAGAQATSSANAASTAAAQEAASAQAQAQAQGTTLSTLRAEAAAAAQRASQSATTAVQASQVATAMTAHAQVTSGLQAAAYADAGDAKAAAAAQASGDAALKAAAANQAAPGASAAALSVPGVSDAFAAAANAAKERGMATDSSQGLVGGIMNAVHKVGDAIKSGVSHVASNAFGAVMNHVSGAGSAMMNAIGSSLSSIGDHATAMFSKFGNQARQAAAQMSGTPSFGRQLQENASPISGTNMAAVMGTATGMNAQFRVYGGGRLPIAGGMNVEAQARLTVPLASAAAAGGYGSKFTGGGMGNVVGKGGEVTGNLTFAVDVGTGAGSKWAGGASVAGGPEVTVSVTDRPGVGTRINAIEAGVVGNLTATGWMADTVNSAVNGLRNVGSKLGFSVPSPASTGSLQSLAQSSLASVTTATEGVGPIGPKHSGSYVTGEGLISATWVNNDFQTSKNPEFRPGMRMDATPDLGLITVRGFSGVRSSIGLDAGAVRAGVEGRLFGSAAWAGGIAFTPAGQNAFGRAISTWSSAG